MAEGIKISSDLDAKPFLRGAGDMTEALEDVSKELKDTSKDGEISVDKLADSFDELAKQAKEAGNKTGDSMRKGFKEAETGAQNFKEEANSTAKEAAASFDGSAESIVDAFQEVAANAFEGFGAAGAIAGLALAAGIGIATAEFQKTEEAAKAAKERIGQLGLAFIESGADVAQVEAFQEALKGIVTNADDASAKIDDLRKFADKYAQTGVKVEELAMAYAGNADAIESVNEKLQLAIELEKENQAQATNAAAVNASKSRQEAYEQEIAKIQGIQEETQAAQAIEEAYLASGGAEAQAKADAIGLINDAYDEVVGSVTDFINAESGVLDVEAYLAAIDAREKALDEYQTALAKSGLSTEQKDALNAMGVDAASAWLKGYESATPEQQRKLKKSLTEASKENSGVARTEIEKAFEKPVNAKVKVDADTSMAQRDLDNLIKARTAIIKVDFQDRYGKKVY